MVYRSFGLECTQQDIWDKVSRHDLHGSRRALTYLLAADALERGLAALVLQAREPWPLLQRCAEHGVRVILNHRIKADSPAGHYAVLVSITDAEVTLHDPQQGPNQTVAREELLKLWEPGWGRCEIVGRVLVAISKAAAAAPACAVCAATLPAHAACPRCRKDMPLEPGIALGCAGEKCAARLWKHLYCPFCDGRRSELPYAEASRAGL
jgi:hypothetical protein